MSGKWGTAANFKDEAHAMGVSSIGARRWTVMRRLDDSLLRYIDVALLLAEARIGRSPGPAPAASRPVLEEDVREVGAPGLRSDCRTWIRGAGRRHRLVQ